MARIVKEHVVRRNEILDAAQRLVYTKGYEQMTIQDILDELQISKGAFYHYFASKQALLEALIERMLDEIEQFVFPIVHDPQLSALEKLERFFATINRWKLAQKDFLLALVRVLYRDENVLFRQKLSGVGIKRLMPQLQVIIRQGVEEGVLTTEYPDQVGEVVISLMQSFGETFSRLILADEVMEEAWPRIEMGVAVYTDALERVLGAPKGAVQLVNARALKEWFLALKETTDEGS